MGVSSNGFGPCLPVNCWLARGIIARSAYPLNPTFLQSISTQIASMTAERQELADRLAVQATRCQYSEQLAKAREQDVSGGQARGEHGLG